MSYVLMSLKASLKAIHNTRLGSGVLLWIGMFLISGCVSAPQTKALLDKQEQFAPAIELYDVAFFPQKQYQCGPAALATVLNYQNINVLPEALTAKVYVPERKGSFQLEMQATVRQYGLIPYIIEPNIQTLIKEVETGNPVLVLQNVGFDRYPIWHFAVVVGYDLQKSQVILRSGKTKRWQTSLANFEQTWKRANYWGLVVSLPSKPSITTAVNKWLRFALDLQMVGQKEAAKEAYIAATQKWPNQLQGYLSLANLYYLQKDYANALQTMKIVNDSVEKSAEYWNNYAYILLKNHCINAASQAIKCALQVNPEDKNLLSSQTDINQQIMEIKASYQLKAELLNCPKILCSE